MRDEWFMLFHDDVVAARARLWDALRCELDLDPVRVARLLRGHRDRLRATQGDDEYGRVLDLVTWMVLDCVGIDILGGDLDVRLGLLVAERVLERSGFLMLPDTHGRTRLFDVLGSVPAAPEPPSEVQVDAVRAWVGRTVADSATGIPLARHARVVLDERQPLQCFVAAPLTGLEPDGEERAHVDDLCERVAAVLAERGILTLSPSQYTSSRYTPVHVNDPTYRSHDEMLVAESDIVLVVVAQKSCGLGVVASLAQRYGKHLLLASPTPDVTPMMTGLDPPPAVLDLRHLDTGLGSYFDTLLPLIEADVERIRGHVVRAERELAELRAALEGLSLDELDRSRHMVMSRRRFRELLNSPALYVGATWVEINELRTLAERTVGQGR